MRPLLQVFAVVLIFAAASPALAASITVNANCSLPQAISSANNDSAPNGSQCVAGSGNDTITLTGNVTLGATQVTSTNITINGAGYSISGNSSVRIFDITSNSLTLRNVTLTRGRSPSKAGGAVAVKGVLEAHRVLFSYNEAYTAPAVYVLGSGRVTITNSTFYENKALTTGGGAVYFTSGSTGTLAHVTMYNNEPAGTGGFSGLYTTGSPTVYLYNSIIVSDKGIDCAGPLTGSAGNLIQSNGTGNHNRCGTPINGDPKLGSVTGSPGYFPLQAGSAANDAGNDAQCANYPTDQSGASRPATNCNIGAVEASESSSTATNTPTHTPVPTNTPTNTPVPTNTLTHTPVPTNTPTNTPVPTNTPTNTPAPTNTPVPTNTPTNTLTPSHTPTGTLPPTNTPTATPTPSNTPTATPTPSMSPTGVPAASMTPTGVATQGTGSRSVAAREASSWRPRASLTPSPTRPPVCTGLQMQQLGYRITARYGICSGVQFRLLDGAGVGNAQVVASGFIAAIDVWGYVSQGVEVCFPQRGKLVFLDAATAPRALRSIEQYSSGGYICAYLDKPGSLVMQYGGPVAGSQQPAGQQSALPGNCMVTTLYILNFREAPGGAIKRVLPAFVTLTALNAQPGWYQVDYHGEAGWISAEYVEKSAACG